MGRNTGAYRYYRSLHGNADAADIDIDMIEYGI